MTADPAPDCAILGFRQDRIGARIVGLLNILRLGQDYGTDARFVWLSDPSGPYPELVDPGLFLAADFVARHIVITTEKPDLTSRRNLLAEASRMDRDLFVTSLHGGARYQSDAAFGILRMIDESPTEVRGRIAEIVAALPLSARLADALGQARARLHTRGQGAAPVAIHVRRGDLLDGLPWSLSSWPAKYVPDEFFRAWVAGQKGPVIAFSDTPAAVSHLAQGCDRIVPVGELLGCDDLSVAERDVLELMLMAECAWVGAPSGSAFSRAAEIVGLARVDALPGDLPHHTRIAAHDALFDRVMTRPDSFYALGDLAQSMQYAGQHALAHDLAPAFTSVCRNREGLCEAHPFVRRILAATALAAGDLATAAQQGNRALADPRLQRRDRVQVDQILNYIALPQGAGGNEVDRVFLDEIFQKGRRSGRITEMLATRVFGHAGRGSAALLIVPELVAKLTAPVAFAAPDTLSGARDLPQWVYRVDWEEFLPNDVARAPLLRQPDMNGKLRYIGGRGADIEAVIDLAEDKLSPAPPTKDDALLIGIYGACLSLHGRFRRALRLHHWLNDCLPDDPLTQKRLSDSCFRLSNLHAGMTHLDRALDLAPDNPLLHLSKARRMADQGRKRGANLHLARANSLWPDLGLIAQQEKLIDRALAKA